MLTIFTIFVPCTEIKLCSPKRIGTFSNDQISHMTRGILEICSTSLFWNGYFLFRSSSTFKMYDWILADVNKWESDAQQNETKTLWNCLINVHCMTVIECVTTGYSLDCVLFFILSFEYTHHQFGCGTTNWMGWRWKFQQFYVAHFKTWKPRSNS